MTTTRLLGIDARSGDLLPCANANAGTHVFTDLMGIGYTPLGLAFDNVQLLGFDISGNSGRGYFNFGSYLYGINSATEAPNVHGCIGTGSLVGLAAGAYVPWFNVPCHGPPERLRLPLVRPASQVGSSALATWKVMPAAT